MPPTQDTAISIWVWLFVLVAMIVAAFVLVAWVTRRLKAADEGSSSVGFTLSDLRELRQQGKMTEEEFERAKTVLLASMRAREVPGKGPPKE